MVFTSASGRVTEGQDYRMECKAEGYPPPVMSWFKDEEKLYSCQRDCSNGGYLIRENRVSNKTVSSLTINRAKSSNSGNYSCTATNSLGSQKQSVQLSVFSK